MLRKAFRIRPLVMALAGALVIVAMACGGDAATPTSPPTATKAPVPTATTAAAVVEPTETPVPGGEIDLGASAEDLLNHPSYDPAWGEPQYGGTLKFRTNMPVRTGSPFRGSGNSHYVGNQMTMRDTLVTIDPWIGWSGGIQPELAESWDLSADGLTYTFELRQDVSFRSESSYDMVDMPGRGELMTCEDAQSHLNFIDSDRYWDEGGSLSSVIPGGSTWTCPDGKDGFTLVGTLDSGIPFPGTLQLLTLPGVYGITNAEWLNWVLENHDPQWIRTAPEYTVHVGTGPFLPVSMTPEVVVTAEANPDYWRPGLPFIDRFEYHTIADPATAFAAFVTDKIDIMGHGSGSPYPPQVEQAMRDFPDKNFVANSYFGARAVGFNTEKPPFDDQRVRKAVNLVMDRQEWHELQRIGETDMHAGYIGGYFNSQNTDYDPMGHSIEEILTWPGFRQPKDDDIAEANRLLDEVFGAGERPGPFKCLSRADDTSTNACLYMGGTIGKHLGINMTLDLYDSATLSSQLKSCNWAFAVTVMPGWEGTPDPYLRYRGYNTDIKGHKPCMGGVDAEVQGTLNQNIQDMQTETDFTKRTVLSKAIEFSLFNEYIPAAGMEWQTIYTGFQPWVKGYSALPHHSIHTGHLKIIQRAWITK